MKQVPVAAKLEYLCRGEVILGDVIQAGNTQWGERRMVPILGGHFEGKINGDVLPGGADAQWMKPDGATAVADARYMIKTTDGAVIYLHNHGLRVISAEALERLNKGEILDPHDYYFRTNPEWETGAPKYAWLNNTVGVCSGVRLAHSALLDFYYLL
jgi:Protein of unknown function (DUF3237)